MVGKRRKTLFTIPGKKSSRKKSLSANRVIALKEKPLIRPPKLRERVQKKKT